MRLIDRVRAFGKYVGITATVLTVLTGVSAPRVSAATDPTFEYEVATYRGTWAKTSQAGPGENLNYLISYQNQTNATQRVTLSDVAPEATTLVAGSTYIQTPAGKSVKQADTLTTTGITTGKLKPNDKVYVQFQLRMPTKAHLTCGDNTIVTQGKAQVASNDKQYSSRTTVTVHKDCQTNPNSNPTPTPAPKPKYSCDAFTVMTDPEQKDRTVLAYDLQYTAKNGAELTYVAVKWGDGTKPQIVNDLADLFHTYKKDGTYTAVAIVHFDVNGRNVTSRCKTTVTVKVVKTTPTEPTQPTQPSEPTTPQQPTQPAQPTQSTQTAVQAAQTSTGTDDSDDEDNEAAGKGPTELANTGAGSVWGIAVAVAIAGAAFRYALLRRAARR